LSLRQRQLRSRPLLLLCQLPIKLVQRPSQLPSLGPLLLRTRTSTQLTRRLLTSRLLTSQLLTRRLLTRWLLTRWLLTRRLLTR
jgi:hypothetical protein